MYLWANCIVCVLAFLGFIYGAVQFFRPKKALYGQMITLALLSVVIGRIFSIVRILSSDNYTGQFQLGTLAIIASLMFFFSSNYGTLDSIVDDGSKENRRYRMTALIAPVVTLILFVPFFLTEDIPVLWKMQGAVIMFFVALCSYFHLKHLIIPDVEFGVVRSIRPYNFLALLYMVSSIVECLALSRDNQVLTLVTCCFSGIFLLLMLPMITYGLKKSRK